MKLKATKEDSRGGSTFVTEFEMTGGLELRDYFAAKALQGLLACNGASCGVHNSVALAYKSADAMLAERKK